MGDSQDLAVRYVGQGFPVLIVHGWTMSGVVEAHDFEPIFTKKANYRRIYVDLPGMGKSPIGNSHNLDSMLESVSNFVEQHILPSKFLLIGSSCGGYLARGLAYKYASAIDGLLLRVPVVEPTTANRDVDPFQPVISDEALLSTLSDTDRKQLDEVTVQTPGYLNTFKRKLQTIWLPAAAASNLAALDLIRINPDLYKLTVAMHTPENPFSKPTLILTGRQDTDVGYRDAWRLVKCYPRATFVALDRGNHGLPVDETNIFEALVNDWLWRVEELQQLDSLPGLGGAISATVKQQRM